MVFCKIWLNNTENVNKSNGIPSTIHKSLNIDNPLLENKNQKKFFFNSMFYAGRAF